MKGIVYQSLIDHFQIRSIDQWSLVRAAAVVDRPKIGRHFLKKLRLWLAGQGISLKDDHPPEYWIKLHNEVPPCDTEPYADCPFTIVVDSNESQPWTFRDVKNRHGQACLVPTTQEAMWTLKLADYSIEGFQKDIQIERKNSNDFVSTLSSGRRENFEEEIHTIAQLCSFAAVVVEEPFDRICDFKTYGGTTKSLWSTITSWMVRYPQVHWIFCRHRQDAEQTAFRLMYSWWWQHQRELLAMDQLNGGMTAA